MTTAAMIVDAIYGIDYPWSPDAKARLRSIAQRMLAEGMHPQDIAMFMSEVIEAVSR